MYILLDILEQLSVLFCIESVFICISFLFLLRICIFSAFMKLKQKSYLTQNMLVLSISEWSHIWHIHKHLLSSQMSWMISGKYHSAM